MCLLIGSSHRSASRWQAGQSLQLARIVSVQYSVLSRASIPFVTPVGWKPITGPAQTPEDQVIQGITSGSGGPVAAVVLPTITP